MLIDFLNLSLNSLKRRRLRSWLTMIGIFIGIAAVVSLISLGAGLKTAIIGQFSSLSADILIVTNAETSFGPPGSTSIKKLTEYDKKIIEKVENVKEVIPRIMRPIKFEYNKILGFEFAASMPDDEKQLEFIYNNLNLKIEEGKELKKEDKGKILLGSEFGRTDNYGKKIRARSKIRIYDEGFEVIGIMKPTINFQLNRIVLMMEKDMKEILNLGDEADMLVVIVSDKDKTEEVGKEIEKKLRQDRNEKEGEEDFSVKTPLQQLSAINTILNIISIVISGIAAISLLVGGIGIANTMYASVLERTREIGVMKAIGARNSDILYIFLIEAGMLGLVGGMIGIFLGLGVAFLASYSANGFFGERIFVVGVNYSLIGFALAFSLVIGIFAGVFPALQASRLKPVEALRGGR